VSHNAAYRHFADRDELLSAVSERCMSRLALLMEQRMAEVSASDPTMTAWGRLNAIGSAYVEFATTEHGWFRTAFAVLHAVTSLAAGEGVGAGGLGPYELLGARLDDLPRPSPRVPLSPASDAPQSPRFTLACARSG
jgi:AcrR family transcriptional regulator